MPPQHKIISLKSKRSLISSSSLAKRGSRRWIVFLPESSADFHSGSRTELASLIGASMARKFNYLAINKPGLGPDRLDRLVFEKSFRRKIRIEDALCTLKAVIPRGHKIHLIGYSEGAYLAPQIANLDKRVRTVCMIGGGTRGWLKEELSNVTQRDRPSFLRKINKIYRNPRSLRKWNGFSYATWFSYRGDNTLRALHKLKIPTLAILGARDRVIDLKSAIVDLMLVSEKKPVQVHIFGNCGHYFTKHWAAVSRVLARFLDDQVS